VLAGAGSKNSHSSLWNVSLNIQFVLMNINMLRINYVYILDNYHDYDTLCETIDSNNTKAYFSACIVTNTRIISTSIMIYP
jgi:hypothetical protein